MKPEVEPTEEINESAILNIARTEIETYIHSDDFSYPPTASTESAVKSTWAMETYAQLRDSVQKSLNELQPGSEDVDNDAVVTIDSLREDNTVVAIATRNSKEGDMLKAYGLTVLWGYKALRKNKTSVHMTTINIAGGQFKNEISLPTLPSFALPITSKTRRVVMEDEFEFVPVNEGKITDVEDIEFEGTTARRTKQSLLVGGAALAAAGAATALFYTTKLALRARNR